MLLFIKGAKNSGNDFCQGRTNYLTESTWARLPSLNLFFFFFSVGDSSAHSTLAYKASYCFSILQLETLKFSRILCKMNAETQLSICIFIFIS